MEFCIHASRFARIYDFLSLFFLIVLYVFGLLFYFSLFLRLHTITNRAIITQNSVLF